MNIFHPKLIKTLTIFVITLGFIATFTINQNSIQAQADNISITKSVDKQHVQRDDPAANAQDVTYSITVDTNGYCNKELDIEIVFDRSGSMNDPAQGGNLKIDLAKRATISFIDEMDIATDRIGLVSYATNATLDSTLTNDFNQIQTITNGLVATGYTNIGDALTTAEGDLLANDRGVEQVIVIFTDGNRTAGPDEAQIETIADNIKANGIQIISVALGTDTNETLLQYIASSPSDFYPIPNETELENTFINIAQSLQYGDTEIVVSDDISQILQYADFVSATDGGYLNGNTVIWDLNGNPCSQSLTVQFVVHVKDDAPDLSNLLNSATATDIASGLSATSSEVTTLIHAPILEINKTDNWYQVSPGSEVDYSIDVVNLGTGNAYEVTIQDDLPDQYFTIYEDTISDNGLYADNLVTWSNISIGFIFDGSFSASGAANSLGQEHNFSYRGVIDENTPIGQNILNSVFLSTNRGNISVESTDSTLIGSLAITGDKFQIYKLILGFGLVFMSSFIAFWKRDVLFIKK